MLRQFQFRWILPVLMTLFNVGLFLASFLYQPYTEPAPTPPSGNYELVIAQPDTAGTDTVFYLGEPKVSKTLKIEMVMNLPVVMCGEIVASLINRADDAAAIGCTTLFVPLLWFGIGRWIDRQAGFAAPGGRKESRLRGAIRTLSRTLAVLFLAVFILAAIPPYRHGTSDTGFVITVVLLWSACYLACSIWGERRQRRMHPAATEQ